MKAVRKDHTDQKESQSKLHTVSLLTISQGSRIKFLEIQKLNIRDQTYNNILEWVIVDGSKTRADSDVFVAYVKDTLVPYFQEKFTINLVPYKEGRKLGGHRNAGNDATKGDFIVCMDDDDYYLDGYVKLAAKSLASSNKQMAGCGPIYIYSLYWKTIFQADYITPNSSVNNAFCYKRSFLKNHRYKDDCESGEEKDFTENFTIPMEQMDPKKVLVQMAHHSNTVDKQKFLMSPLFNMRIGFNLTNMKIEQLVPEDKLRQYEATINPSKESPYDIVYYAGLLSIEWNPASTSLGGSEQAVVQLAKQWAKMGKTVAVYGELAQQDMVELDGVHFYHFKDFHPQDTYKNLILWRLYGSAPVLRTNVVKAEKIFVDIHDNIPQHYEIIQKNIQKVDHVMFKSHFHVNQYTRMTGHKLPVEKIVIIPNGIQKKLFELEMDDQQNVLPRNPYRFCYCSSYDRGLIPIMKHLWRLLVQMEPRVELHLYYGVDKKDQNQQRLVQEFYNTFLNTSNVMDHGRQSIEQVAREKHMSTFQLYITNAPAEIDCISVRESLVAGCIPILLKENVFAERDGFHVTGSLEDPKECLAIAIKILDLMHDRAQCDDLREKLAKSPTIVDWTQVADVWTSIFA